MAKQNNREIFGEISLIFQGSNFELRRLLSYQRKKVFAIKGLFYLILTGTYIYWSFPKIIFYTLLFIYSVGIILEEVIYLYTFFDKLIYKEGYFWSTTFFGLIKSKKVMLDRNNCTITISKSITLLLRGGQAPKLIVIVKSKKGREVLKLAYLSTSLNKVEIDSINRRLASFVE